MKGARFIGVAAGGACLWLAFSVISKVGGIPLTLIEQLFLLSPVIVVPLGLAILNGAADLGMFPTWTPWTILVAGWAACAAFGLPRGLLSGALASAWVCVTIGLAWFALRALLRHGVRALPQVCFIAACLYLPVGGIWLVISRLGITSLGFEEPMVLLTAVHFHNSGFAAPILVGAAAEKFRRSGGRAPLRAVAAGVLATPALIAAGFVFAPLLKLIASVWLALSLGGLALWTVLRIRNVTPVFARVLIAISAGSVLGGMVLSSIYAAGEFAGREWIRIPTMAITHGILNGVGFVLCGLLGQALTRIGKAELHLTAFEKPTREETRICVSPLPVGRDSSATTWRDGWSN